MNYLSNLLRFLPLAFTAGCMVAAILFFWPGALATVSSVTLFGVSIASLAGPGFLSQVGAVCALTTCGLFATGFLIDLVASLASLIQSCSHSKSDSKNTMTQDGNQQEMFTNYNKIPQGLVTAEQKQVPFVQVMHAPNPCSVKRGAPTEYSDTPCPAL